jgi:hypothetical protein
VLAAVVAIAASGLLSSSCYTQGETTCGQEEEPLVPLRGKIVGEIDVVVGKEPDGKDKIETRTVPQEGSLVFVELCGRYTGNPDPSKAHPNYRHGAVTRADGTFEVLVPRGPAGLHTFKDGYQYGTVPVADTAAPVPEFRETLRRGKSAPVLSDFKVTPAEASPGQMLRFSVNAKAAPRDPMSEEVIVLEPTSGTARAFAPPRRGMPGHSYPDGVWTTSMAAPAKPGTYTFLVQSTSEGCVVSNRLPIDVVVR